MTEFTRRCRELIEKVRSTDDWSDLAVEDAVAIVLAGVCYSEASTKFPDLFSDLYLASVTPKPL